MEKSKINSQDLIEKSGGGDLIFHTALPAKVVFDLQRFANINISQSGTDGNKTTAMSASEKISSALYAYTLGRSNSKDSSKSAGDTVAYAGSDKIQFAPLGTKTTSNAQSYSLSVYSAGANNYRIALDGTAATAAAAYTVGTAFTATAGTAYAGIAINNNFNNTASFAGTYTAKEFSAADVTSESAGTGYSSSQFDGTYKGLWFEVGTAGDSSNFGMALESVATGSSSQTYSLDFYDVKGTDGTYHVKSLAGTREILAASANTYTFGGITSGETEAYNFNGVGVSATAIVASASDYTAKVAVNTFSTANDYTPEFTISTVNSNTELTFSFQEQTAIKIDNISYTASEKQGTLAFTKLAGTGDVSAITLGNKAKFDNVFTGGEKTAYGLESYASGTFTASSALYLDIDGFGTAEGNSAYDIMSFTGTANVFAIAGNSEVTIYGDNANLTATGSSVYKLAYNLSDTTNGVSLKIGNLTFTDAKNDNTNTVISFKDQSSDTVQFNGNFSVVANGQTYGISDTNGAALSWIKFGATSETLTIGSGVAIGGTFNNVLLSEAGTDTIKNGAQLYNFTVTGTSDATKNKATFFNNTPLTADTSHVFSPAVTTASGVSFGENLSLGTSTLAVSAGTAQVFGDFFFGASAASGDTASGTVLYKAASDITLTGGTLDISGVSGTKLVGLSGATFTVNSTGANFYLRDGGTGTTINSITFSEVSDSKITKLALTQNATSTDMTIFGNLSVTAGSGTKMNYLLGSTTSVYNTNSIAFGDLKFIGTGTSTAPVGVGMGTVNTFGLSATGKTSVLTVSGTSVADSIYALSKGSSGTFKFGIVSIDGSNTGLANVVNVSGFGGDLNADATSATFTINSGNFSIKDAADSASFKVSALSGGLFAISEIDSGATLYSVASTTKVITNGAGVFTFSNTFTGSVTGAANDSAAKQVFTIINDSNGVTFNVNSATGLVTSIEGIDANAKVTVTDYTKRGTNNSWTKSSFTGGSWTMLKDSGLWEADQAFLGYIVGNTATSSPAAFTILGVNSTTGVHETANQPNTVGSSTGVTFALNNPFGDQPSGATATSVLFTNAGAAYGAQSGLTVLFTNFKGSTSNTGLLYSSEGALSLGAIGTTGTAKGLTSLAGLSDTTLSMTLGGLALSLATDYVVSGTGVALSANKNYATISAIQGTSSDAYISAPLDTAFAFGSTTGVYNIYSGTDLRHSLTVSASAENQAFGSNTDIFSLSILTGALVTDTFKADGKGDSSLKVNGALYGLAADSGTLVVAGGTKDTATFVTGTFSMAFANATDTGLAFAKDASLVFDGYSYTGKAAATSFMTLGAGKSDSHVVSVADNGLITGNVAESKAFTFWLGKGDNLASSLFKATTAVTYDIGGTYKNGLLGGTAEGIVKKGTYTIDILSDTFTMGSGTVTLSVGTAYAEQSATTKYTSGIGSGTFTTFALSDYYFASGTSKQQVGSSAEATKYFYSGTSVVLNLGFANGREYINYVSGVATRTDSKISDSSNDFVFALRTGTALTGVATTYTGIGNAFTFVLNASSTSAAGSFYSGSGTRLVGADGIAISNTGLKESYLTFNQDSYTTLLANSVLGISVDAGKGTETFVSGSAMFTAPATGIFHFDINGSETGGVQAYSATKTISLYAGFGSDTSKGQLYKITKEDGTTQATGLIGSRVLGSTATETKLYWTDSYTLQGGATVGLNIDANLGSTETVTAGSAIYTTTDGVFHIARNWTSGTKLTSLDGETYSYTAVGEATLGLYIDNGSYTSVIQSGLGTRLENDATSFTFKLGSTVNTYTKLTGSSLFFSIDNSSTSAFGSFYSGTGTRVLDAALAASNTLLKDTPLTLNGDTYTTLLNGSTMIIGVDAGKGTETFVSGSAMFTAPATGIFHFDINGSETGGVQAYSATKTISLYAGFGSDTSKGQLYKITKEDGTTQATGLIGSRVLGSTATETKLYWTDSYTLQGGATVGLNIDANLGSTETVTAGSAIYTTTDGVFHIARNWTSGTKLTSLDGETYSYTAVGEATLGLYIDNGSYTSVIQSGLGTRLENDATSFTFKLGSTVNTYTKLTGSSLIYSIDNSSTSAFGTFYAGTGTRQITATTAVSDTGLSQKFLTLANNSYTQLTGATLQLNAISPTAGTETFVSGSATFTAAAGDTFFAIASGMSKAVAYTAGTGGVSMSAGFTSISDGTLFAASGIGSRTLDTAKNETATYVLSALSETFTMTAGNATITLSDTNLANNIYGIEQFTSGTGTRSVANIGDTFALSDYYLGASGTSSAATPYVYTASTTGVLTLNMAGVDSQTITIGSSLVGTRKDADLQLVRFCNLQDCGRQRGIRYTLCGYTYQTLHRRYRHEYHCATYYLPRQ